MHCAGHNDERSGGTNPCGCKPYAPPADVTHVQVLSVPSAGAFVPASFSLLSRGKCSRRITSLAISNDVQRLAVGCSDGSIAMADVCDAVAAYEFVRRHDGASLGCSRCGRRRFARV